uniref:Retroviral envelope protein GP41-like domain-containing protein n=1 Tax=Peromyscus maniculatus bairdii TaxID=230844 RepID=A0A8C8UEE4_PERMB
IPAFAVMPWESPSDQFPLQLKRTRRDFGITAAIVAAVAASAVTATAAGLALSQTVQQAAVINTLSERVAGALDIQQTLNGQLHFGILMLNQQASLLQEQIDILWIRQHMLCAYGVSEVCITPHAAFNASAKVAELNAYL